MDKRPTIKQQLKPVVEQVMGLFIAKDYGALVQLAGSARFTERDIPAIERIVSDYPADLVVPPESAYETAMDVCKIEGSSPQRWAVDMFFWTQQEGMSDLQMRLTNTDNGGQLAVELDSVLVP